MDHLSAASLLGAYALHACDEDETAEVAEHVRTCDECAAELATLQEVAGWLGADEIDEPPADMRRTLLDRIIQSDPST